MRAKRRSGQHVSPAAAVDVGTNSVRLLIVADDGTRIQRRIVTTRLGYGVDRTGRFDDTALKCTLDVLAEFAADWHASGVSGNVRIVATSAVRDATDRDRFFAGVLERTGHAADVISGAEEAALAYTGATAGVGIDTPCVVVDIGGGSTELVVGDKNRRVVASVSLQLGCVRLAERYFHTDPVRPESIAEATREITTRLEAAADVRDAARRCGAATMIGVAGTVTTLGALHLGLSAYDEDAIHGTLLTRDTVAALTRELLAKSTAERRALGPVQPGREDVLHAGALILNQIVTQFNVDGVTVSERDSLDGVAASLL